MLLITHEDVRHEWTFAGEERDGHLNGLSVPVLRVLALKALLLDDLFELMEKTVLRAHTKVADGEEAHLFEEELT